MVLAGSASTGLFFLDFFTPLAAAFALFTLRYTSTRLPVSRWIADIFLSCFFLSLASFLPTFLSLFLAFLAFIFSFAFLAAFTAFFAAFFLGCFNFLESAFIDLFMFLILFFSCLALILLASALA